ncbi:MAG: macro domain-containing protein [Thermoanaerobaculia bacterium]
MLKLEFKEATPVLMVLAALAIGIALLGINPLDTHSVLAVWVRVAFGVLGVVFLVLSLFLSRRSSRVAPEVKPTSDYLERFKSAQEQMASLVPDNQVLGEAIIGRSTFIAINGNVLDATADVVVSSDDNHFTARGGVAKAILTKAGHTVEVELENLRGLRFQQGHIAVTTGGAWKRRALIHGAVIDLDENRYPTEQVVRLVVRRSLGCAAAIGARSVALPVLGGGTASKWLKPADSVRAIATEVLSFLRQHESDGDGLSHVALYIFNRDDASGLPGEMKGIGAAQHSHAADQPAAGS